MGILSWLKREERADNTVVVTVADALLTALMGGKGVTKETALQVPTVAGGVDLIANVVASTPVKLYRDRDGKAEEVRDDRRLRLLNDDPGDTLSAHEFWRAIVRDYYLGKGGYAYINRQGGRIQSLHYVDEAQISIVKTQTQFLKILIFWCRVAGTSHLSLSKFCVTPKTAQQEAQSQTKTKNSLKRRTSPCCSSSLWQSVAATKKGF